VYCSKKRRDCSQIAKGKGSAHIIYLSIGKKGDNVGTFSNRKEEPTQGETVGKGEVGPEKRKGDLFVLKEKK